MAADRAASRACAEELLETIPLVMRMLRSEMRSHGVRELSVAQFRALIFLRRNDGASLGEVASHLGVTQPTASAIVNRLVRQGLMTRAPHPEELRKVALGLTDEGRKLVVEAREGAKERMAAALDPCSGEELLCMRQGLALLKEVFGGGAGR